MSETSDPSNATGINGDQKNTSAPDSGAVFIFNHSGDTWSQQAYVKPGNTTPPGLLFGYSVGLNGNGDTLGVGAYNDNGRRGAVYVFTRNNGTWSQQMRVMATNGAVGDYLGCSLAISDDGNTILAGAVEDKFSQINAGQKDLLDSVGGAYVFVRAADKWSQQAYVKAFNPRENDQFGWALAISRDGNTIAIGSHLEDSGAKGVNGDQSDASMEDSGAVYVYTRTGTNWNPTAYVKASNTQPAAEFGISVALNGDGKCSPPARQRKIAPPRASTASRTISRPSTPAPLTSITDEKEKNGMRKIASLVAAAVQDSICVEEARKRRTSYMK